VAVVAGVAQRGPLGLRQAHGRRYVERKLSPGGLGEHQLVVAQLDEVAIGVLERQAPAERHGPPQPDLRAGGAQRRGREARHVAAVRDLRQSGEARVDDRQLFLDES
jgi:hypothetical protein